MFIDLGGGWGGGGDMSRPPWLQLLITCSMQEWRRKLARDINECVPQSMNVTVSVQALGTKLWKIMCFIEQESRRLGVSVIGMSLTGT